MQWCGRSVLHCILKKENVQILWWGRKERDTVLWHFCQIATRSKACWSKVLAILPLVTLVSLLIWWDENLTRKPICLKMIWEKNNLDEAEDSPTNRKGGKCFDCSYSARYVPIAITPKRSCAGERQELNWMSQYDWTTAAREIKNTIIKSFAHFSF